MKKSSCGINGDGVLRGLRRSMVVFIGPWWCSSVHGGVHRSIVVFIGPWWCSSVHVHVCYGGYARHMLKLVYCF